MKTSLAVSWATAVSSSASLLVALLLSGCATVESNPDASTLFHDHLFSPPTERIQRDDVFAVSDEMRRYLANDIADQLREKRRQQGLFNALYSKDQLKLEYDSVRTRNAQEAFAARAGNCLSLAIMTAALAREMGLNISFQRVFAEQDWSRSGGIYFSSGHVNLTLGKRQYDGQFRFGDGNLLTIDFYPLRENVRQHAWIVGEDTIIAMYMNNRAAESLVAGNVNNAYWWAREAVLQDSNLLISHNTLAVIYRHHKNLAEAESVLNYALAREPDNLQVMSNLVIVFSDQGRAAESKALTLKVAEKQPYPPFHFFNLGQIALRDGNFKVPQDLFTREVARSENQSELHFWLASAYFGLGEISEAQKHLALAKQNSATPKEHALYAAKLERLKSYRN